MSNTVIFIYKLSLLVIPAVILTALLMYDNAGGGIGGGGYDLSGIVYGGLLYVVILVWLLWTAVAYFRSSDKSRKKIHLWLLCTGFLVFVAALFATRG